MNRATAKLLVMILVVMATLGLWAQSTTAPYYTMFPATENPISEGGNWKNGLADGVKWGDVQTGTGKVYGTSISDGCSVGSGNCNDSTAVLTGTYGANQSACGVVYLNTSGFSRNSNFYEIELRLNTSISANSITGYEMNYSTHDGSSSPYIQIVRWNGAYNQFTLKNSLTPTRIMTNGDTVCFTNVGGTLQAYINGTAQFTGGNAVTDTTYTGGAPGVGFFNENGTTGDNSHFGWSNFAAFAQASGSIRIAATTSQTDVNTQITASSAGDTIWVPAGSSNWASGVSISGKWLNLFGQGSGRIVGRSSSTIALGTGSKSLAVTSTSVGNSLNLYSGEAITVSETGNRTNVLTGTVTSWNGTTLVFNATSSAGSCGNSSTSNCGRWLIATIPVTTITNNSSGTLFSITENASGNTSWGGIKVAQGSGAGNVINLNFTNGAKAILVHDCWIEQGTGDDIFSNTNRGVIWNCSFDSSPFSLEPLAIHLKEPSPTGTMAQSWTTTANWGNADTTGDKELYAESSDFHAYLNATDIDDNGRAVFRYNYMDNAGFGTHGADTSTYGQRYFEYYNNTGHFDPYSSCSPNCYTFNMNWWVFMRGGTMVMHDNTLDAITSTDYGSKPDVSVTVMNLQRSAGPDACWAALAGSCISASAGQYYHAPRQIGFGRVTGTGTDGLGRTNDSITYVGDSEPMYFWNNGRTMTGLTTPDSGLNSGTNCGNIAACDSASNYFQLNRDYFNSAKPSYTASTYPNPLTGQSGGGTPTAATPSFSPVAGTYGSTQVVTVSSSTPSATLCRTTDGSTPTADGNGTCTHGTTMTNGATVTISVTTVLSAIATKSGYNDSGVASGTYTIGGVTLNPPTNVQIFVK